MTILLLLLPLLLLFPTHPPGRLRSGVGGWGLNNSRAKRARPLRALLLGRAREAPTAVFFIDAPSLYRCLRMKSVHSKVLPCSPAAPCEGSGERGWAPRRALLAGGLGARHKTTPCHRPSARRNTGSCVPASCPAPRSDPELLSRCAIEVLDLLTDLPPQCSDWIAPELHRVCTGIAPFYGLHRTCQQPGKILFRLLTGSFQVLPILTPYGQPGACSRETGGWCSTGSGAAGLGRQLPLALTL